MGTIVAALISFLVSFITVSVGNKRENFVYQDDQTKWVNRLLEVTMQTNDKLDEKELLVLMSCLRPVKKTTLSDDEVMGERTMFMNNAIGFCNSKYKENGEFIPLSNQEKVVTRLICNILLKEHWEYLTDKNKYQSKLEEIFSYGSSEIIKLNVRRVE